MLHCVAVGTSVAVQLPGLLLRVLRPLRVLPLRSGFAREVSAQRSASVCVQGGQSNLLQHARAPSWLRAPCGASECEPSAPPLAAACPPLNRARVACACCVRAWADKS